MSSILSSAKPLIQVVRLANAICVKNGIGQSGDRSGEHALSLDMLAPLKLDAAGLQAIEQELGKNMEKAGAFLNAYR